MRIKRDKPKFPTMRTFQWDEKDYLTTNECLALSGFTDLQLKQLLKLYYAYSQHQIYQALTRTFCGYSKPSVEDISLANKFKMVLMTPPSEVYDSVWNDNQQHWLEQTTHTLAGCASRGTIKYVVDNYHNGIFKPRQRIARWLIERRSAPPDYSSWGKGTGIGHGGR